MVIFSLPSLLEGISECSWVHWGSLLCICFLAMMLFRFQKVLHHCVLDAEVKCWLVLDNTIHWHLIFLVYCTHVPLSPPPPFKKLWKTKQTKNYEKNNNNKTGGGGWGRSQFFKSGKWMNKIGMRLKNQRHEVRIRQDKKQENKTTEHTHTHTSPPPPPHACMHACKHACTHTHNTKQQHQDKKPAHWCGL